MSPGSPGGEDSGGEQGRSKPRLQRSKAQSRKTFRLRKSRKSKIEVSHIKVDPPPPLDIVTSEAPQILGAPLELSVTSTLTPPSSASSLPPPCSPLSIHGRGSSGRSRLHREISYEEDSAISQTSSTSGYREGFADRHSFLMLESPPTPLKQFSPPLASPDIHDLPSTSSASQTAGETAVRHPLEQESSAESMNSGEDTALLPDASTPQPDSLSPPPHHPLLEPFDRHQDEDTLL
ncbi:hypothetical protein B566_EDAN005286 [Ephemera danica]|nr:hypothetical protein B566_EDAN005286 [Ephemera danica]